MATHKTIGTFQHDSLLFTGLCPAHNTGFEA